MRTVHPLMYALVAVYEACRGRGWSRDGSGAYGAEARVGRYRDGKDGQ